MKNYFLQSILTALVFLQMGCDSGGGSGSASSGKPPSSGIVKPTSNELADDDFDDTRNIDDCAPLDSAKKVLLYQDADGDGFGTNTTGECSPTYRLGYVDNNLDCNDSDSNFKRWSFRDADADSYGDPAVKICAISTSPIPNGYVDNNFDSNDTSASQNLLVPNYKDADGDGYGTSEVIGYSSTNAIVGASLNSTDCDDNNATNYRILSVYRDADADGYGSGAPVVQCIGSALPSGYVTFGGDCNDSNGSVYLNQYIDADGDGFGAGTPVACTNSNPQVGKSFSNADCNDADSNKKVLWSVYNDADSDGQGIGSVQSICAGISMPAGKANNNLDCDDSNNQKKSFSAYYDFDNDGYGSGEVQNICTNAIASPYVANNTDCNSNDGKLWKEINLSSDDDGDGKGNVDGIRKFCVGRSVHLSLISNNTDYFKNDSTRWLKTASVAGVNGKPSLNYYGIGPYTQHVDGSGNIISVSQGNIGNYCDSATGQCTNYTYFCNSYDRCILITKRNSSNAILWQKLIKVDNNLESLNVKIFKLTSSGDIVIGGSFSGTVDFDPNAGTKIHSQGPFQYLYQYTTNMFVLKISTNGDYIDHRVNSNFSRITSSIYSPNGEWMVSGETSGVYNFGTTTSPASHTNFIGILQDDLTFRNVKFGQQYGRYFLNLTNQYVTMTDSGINTSARLIVLDTSFNYLSEMPFEAFCYTSSCISTQNARGKLFTILNGTSYEFEPNTGVIKILNLQPLNIKFVMYDLNEKIVYVGTFAVDCTIGSTTCIKPTKQHDWTGFDGTGGYIIVGDKNYFWKNSSQTLVDLISSDGQNFILKANMPKLSGGQISHLYSQTNSVSNVNSAFNITTGFMWSVVP